MVNATEMDAVPIVAGVTMVALLARDQPRLAELCRRCTDFFELVEGQPGGPETAAELLGPLPARVASGRRRVFGIERGGDLIGVAELLEGYPGPNEWYVGLLALVPELRRRAIGTDLWAGLRDWMRGRKAAAVRLVVQNQNPSAKIFWARQGFTVEEEVIGTSGKLTSPVSRMRLAIAEDAVGRR
jgi:ribosomal protein S18 acetylase RimI-like enzyme